LTEGLRVGVIGLGIGESHIAGYEADPRCRVTALCDIDAKQLAAVGARHPGRRLTTAPDEVLDDPEIGAVSIASYDDAHADQVVRALARGKHVFVEKPLCLTDGELAAVAVALRRAPRLQLSSNLILRKAPRFLGLRQRIRAGDFGRLYYAEGDYTYGRLAKILEGWRGRLPFYSVMHGGGIHMVDLLLWLVGERPERATAVGSRLATAGTAFRHNDMVAALLEFPSGMIAKVTANFACVLPHGHAVALYGTAATFLQNALGAAVYRDRNPAARHEPATEPATSAGNSRRITETSRRSTTRWRITTTTRSRRLKLLERMKSAHGLRRLVYASAGCTVAQKTFDAAEATRESDPVSLQLDSPYQISKIIGELYGNYYHARHGVPFVKARFQNVYGPGEILGAGAWRGTPATVWRNVTPTFIWKALNGETLPVENGGVATRDFIYVDDVVEGLIACALRGAPGETYNLASGVETSIKDLAELINTLTGNKTPAAMRPAREWDRSGKRYGDPSKARAELGFAACVALRDGLARTIDWTRQHRALIERAMARHARFMRAG
jgi:predicted dehydrogenase